MAKIKNPLPMTVSWNGANAREFYIDSLIKEKSWSVGCEVGVRYGRTLFHLLDNNPTLKMYAVDKDVSQFYDNNIKEKYKDRLIILEGNSWDCANQINETLDFVFIDAAHSTKNVVKDIKAYQPLLKDNYGLLGHDVDFPAIQQALQKLEINYDVGPDNVWSFKD